MDTIASFDGDFAFLSNFFVEPDGTTVEHEFAAAKTHDLREQVRILTASTPGQAKRLGRKVTLRPDWEDVKVNVMRSLVLRKFLDHPDLARRLLATSDATLVEGNHWHDNTWGDCSCERCAAIEGRNALGEILMEVRQLIRAW